MSLLKQMQQELLQLEEHSNLRHLPKMTHDGREVIVNNKRMLNLSSNDYLGRHQTGHCMKSFSAHLPRIRSCLLLPLPDC